MTVCDAKEEAVFKYFITRAKFNRPVFNVMLVWKEPYTVPNNYLGPCYHSNLFKEIYNI